jgi:large subunit ribosomal protein L1
MSRHGKQIIAGRSNIERQKRYELAEAVKLAQENAYAKFDESVDLAIRLGVNPAHADQMVRGTVPLPHGTGKEVRVLVFAKGDKEVEAREAGADYVGAEDLAEKIQGGWFDFDCAVATPDMMGVVGRLGRVLGPRGLMPNPKTNTVTPNVAQAIKELKAGRVEFRTEKSGIIQIPVGKKGFTQEQLVDNIQAVIDALIKAKPASAKGTYLQTITVSTTMGPGVKIDPSVF